jgi:DNA-directed RNA polymerase specialized sigma24 family protein
MVSGLKFRTMTELHPVIYDLVPSVANTIYRRYKNYVERDDIKQECMAWAMTRANDHNVDLMEPIEERRRHNEQRIAYQMRRVAERYARKEKAVKSGYQTVDEVYYESFTLGQLLPFVIASVIDGTVLEQVQQMIQDGQPKGKSSPSEGGNLLASLIDIKKGYLQLEVEDQTLLRLRHHENFTLQQIAGHLECAISTADRRCAHSLRRLQEILGGISPWG